MRRKELDYRLGVMEDCSGDHAPDVHDFLSPHIFPRQTKVATAVEAIQAWAIQSLTAPAMDFVQIPGDRGEADGLGCRLSGRVSALASAQRLLTPGGHRGCWGP